MAGSGSAQMAQSNIRWYQATFEAGDKSVRVQYLSDHKLDNDAIADLVAKGQNYGRAWIDDRAQGSASRIASASELIREAGAPAENKVAARPSAEDIERFTGRRTVEAVEAGARRVGEWAIETGERVISALGTPVRTEGRSEERASGRRHRTTVVAETAMGEEAEVQSAAVRVEVPQAEAPRAEERKAPGREDTTTIPQSDLRGNTYEFRIAYDPSKLEPGYTDADLHSVKFFEKPENRDAVIGFSYRNVGVGGDWNNELGGKLFHRVYSRLFEMADFALVDGAGHTQMHFTVYIDREKAEQLGVDTSDPLALIRSGVILRIMQGAIGNETRWRRGSTEDVIAAWEEFIKKQREDNKYEMRVGRA